MPAINAKVVTTITVFGGREHLLKAFVDLGVHSYSAFHVEGVGVHGEQRGGFFQNQNVVYVAVASEQLAARLLAWVEAHLLPNFPSIAYSTDALAVSGAPIA